MAFIKPSYSQGILPEILSQASASSSVNPQLIAKDYLKQLSESKPSGLAWSSVYADRIAATMDIAAPNIISNNLLADIIAPASGKDLLLQLSDNGLFQVKGSSESAGITFDAYGNAVFSGTVRADRLVANVIEGLDFAEKSDRQAITDGIEIASGSAVVKLPFVSKEISVFLSDLYVNGKAIFNNSLEIFGELIVKAPATFLADTLFTGRVFFNSDTAGSAVIPIYETKVTVPFEKTYEEPPVITITLNIPESTQSAFMADGLKAAVTDVSTRDFTIMLESPAPRELSYYWIAIAVKNQRRVVGASTMGKALGEVAGATVTPVITPLIGQTTTTPTPSLMIENSGQLDNSTASSQLNNIETNNSTSSAKLNGNTITIKETDLGFVRLRKNYTVDSEEIGQIPSGTILTYDALEYGWYHVKYNDLDGWISGTFVIKG